jgi:hypothetical protein
MTFSFVYTGDTLGNIIYYCGRDDEKALPGEKERDWMLQRYTYKGQLENNLAWRVSL